MEEVEGCADDVLIVVVFTSCVCKSTCTHRQLQLVGTVILCMCEWEKNGHIIRNSNLVGPLPHVHIDES